MSKEILVVPYTGQGHLFPCVELCRHFTSIDFNPTLIVTSKLTSSIAPSIRKNPNVEILEIPGISEGSDQPAVGVDTMIVLEDRQRKMGMQIEKMLVERFERLGSNSSKPVCAVIDTMLWLTKDVFWRLGIPVVTLFTSGASCPVVDFCAWKNGVMESEIKPCQILKLPGLPEEMAFSFNELKRRPPPGFHDGLLGAGPPRLGDETRWVGEVEGSVGLMVNTCDELEGEFLKYLSNNMEIPVWGVGPLLPEDFWNPSGILIRDGTMRARRVSNYTEDEVMEWLDSKPRGSVLYVSFGSELSPSNEEYNQLAKALEESDWPFIWVLQPNALVHNPLLPLHSASVDAETDEPYFPSELVQKVGNRGLIINGWAPQLMILSHSSTGGFLSHCGWNSTVEAIGRGIPILAFPIRGDQLADAKLVVSMLKIGYMITDNFSEAVEKDQIAEGIELLMSDHEMKKRAEAIAAEFGKCFPPSSVVALDAFRNFITSPK